MTPSQLKYEIESRYPDNCYFSRSSMRFFGDTMANYGVRQAIVIAHFDAAGNYHEEGVKREAWELYRKRAVKFGNKESAYFDKVTFERIHSIKG